MTKKTAKRHAEDVRHADGRAAPRGTGTRRPPSGKLRRKTYEAELARLQGELVAMQEWVKATGAKICVVFEGRDTAGKGGTIKRITERVSPRVFRVVALPTPTEREKSQMYLQRYVPHFPAAGEVIIFDRSWYNRAGVEKVMGFCTPEQTERFLEMVPAFETGDGRLRDHPDQVLAGGRSRGADPPAGEPHRRPAQGLEALRAGPALLQPLVRLLPRSRRHVRGLGLRVGAVVPRVDRRQEAGPAEHHQPPAQPDPLRAAAEAGRRPARPAEGAGLPASRPACPGPSRRPSERPS